MRLPPFLRPKGERHAFVLGLDLEGNIVANLQDPSRRCYAPITSAREFDGFLYLGSLERDALGRIPIPGPPETAD